MKKQALSFFFFIMLNLAMAKDASMPGQYRFSAGMESGIPKNRINLRNREEEEALLVGDISMAAPVYFSDNAGGRETLHESRQWYKITNHYKGDGRTGYIWDIPVSLPSGDASDRSGPLALHCYGLTSFHVNTGVNFAVRIFQVQKLLRGITHECSIVNHFPDTKWNCSIFMDIYGEVLLPEIEKLVTLSFHYQQQGVCNDELVLITNRSGILFAGRQRGFQSRFGFPLKHYLS